MWTIFYHILALLGVCTAILFALKRIRKNRKSVWTAVPCAFLFAYGWVAFGGQGMGAYGHLPYLGTSFEWPILFTDGAVMDSLGTTYVPHVAAGRIQAYDKNGVFLRGWFVDAHGGDFHLHVTEDDILEVYIARGNEHLVFQSDGTLVREGQYPESSWDALPTGPPSDIKLAPAWYLYPFTNSFFAWLIGAAGLVGILIHEGILRKRVQPQTS